MGWDVRFGSLCLDQRAEVLPVAGGSATRVRLGLSTGAQGPAALLLPLLRSRFCKTMTTSLRMIATLLERSEQTLHERPVPSGWHC